MCGVWEVGPLSLFLWGSSLSAAGGLCSFLFCPNGLILWGCTIPLREGGFDGETTLPVWAAGWGQDSGVGVMPGVVWEGIYRGHRACRPSSLTACKSPLHWTSMLMFCLHIGWLLLGDAMVTPPSPPFPHLWGASQLDCRGPWKFLSPPGVQRWPCCAPP
jgi:hypothetical protein